MKTRLEVNTTSEYKLLHNQIQAVVEKNQMFTHADEIFDTYVKYHDDFYNKPKHLAFKIGDRTWDVLVIFEKELKALFLT